MKTQTLAIAALAGYAAAAPKPKSTSSAPAAVATSIPEAINAHTFNISKLTPEQQEEYKELEQLSPEELDEEFIDTVRETTGMDLTKDHTKEELKHPYLVWLEELAKQAENPQSQEQAETEAEAEEDGAEEEEPKLVARKGGEEEWASEKAIVAEEYLEAKKNGDPKKQVEAEYAAKEKGAKKKYEDAKKDLNKSDNAGKQEAKHIFNQEKKQIKAEKKEILNGYSWAKHWIGECKKKGTDPTDVDNIREHDKSKYFSKREVEAPPGGSADQPAQVSAERLRALIRPLEQQVRSLEGQLEEARRKLKMYKVLQKAQAAAPSAAAATLTQAATSADATSGQVVDETTTASPTVTMSLKKSLPAVTSMASTTTSQARFPAEPSFGPTGFPEPPLHE